LSPSSFSPSCAVVFAFLQAYWAEKNSQAVAYDLRNDLYAKIQQLSFSYHDKNQTGQLMIRATDDVEKVRLFIGQGLLATCRRHHFAGGYHHHFVHTNVSLAWTAMPIPACGIGAVHGLWRHCQPALVCKGAAKAFRIEYGLAGKPRGHQGHQGFYARKTTAKEIPCAVPMTR
jgi:ABC-type multidrug transport system fused ATPase/permease subunit